LLSIGWIDSLPDNPSASGNGKEKSVDATSINPVVFAYNFPHKKTQDFLQRLVLIGAKPDFVLLADRVELNLPNSGRLKPRHADLVHPQTICERFSLPYEVVDHASERCFQLLSKRRPPLGIIAGARILPRAIIDCFTIGVINFHPGLIPEVRGLDALQWALHYDLPLGVTAHLIDHRVDAGRIVERRLIDEYADDTLIDLSLRLYETQVHMLSSTLASLMNRDPAAFEMVTGAPYRRSFPVEHFPGLAAKLSKRLARRRSAA